MKNFILTLLTITYFSGIIGAQCPINASVTFSNQAEIDSFIIQYPNCTELASVTIEEESSGAITHLLGLQNIESTEQLFIVSNDSLKNLNGLESLEVITGFVFTIQENQSLETLQGLNNLHTLMGLSGITNNQNLKSLSGLENLSYIENDINITNNPLLKNLTGLEGLKKINRGFIAIQNNRSMTSLIGMQNLTQINLIIIEDNENLISLAGLGEVDNTLMELQITNNPKLSICNEFSICRYLTNGGFHTISGNALGCNNEANSSNEILLSCTNFSKINSRIFSDFNENKIQDADEPIFPGAGIQVQPLASLYYPQPNQANQFYLDVGEYEISLDQSTVSNWQLTTDSATYHISLDSTLSCDTLLFGIIPSTQLPSMTAYINAPPARCNEIITIDFHTKNIGTLLTEGTLWLEVDERIDSIIFLQNPDSIVLPNRYGWHFDTLYPGYSYSQLLQVRIPGPPDFPLGELLHFTSFASYSSIFGPDVSHTFHYDTEVRCSYDPNDKLVNPQRTDNLTLFEEDLYYTIRFQNTGNDFAYDVVIRDTLDANLDPSSFQLLSSSHPEQLQASMDDNRYLTFDFQNIFLPDSTADLEGSQGYVSYLISPKEGLAENTEIYNTAAIYFDFNPPIITNTTENIMVSELVSLHELEENEQLGIFPNPTHDRLFIQSSSTSIGQLQLMDQLGRVVLQREIVEQEEIDLNAYGSGIYFLSIQIDGQQVTEKIIKL